MRIAVYTAIFGTKAGLINQPKFLDVDYVCFTDNESLKSKLWNVRLVKGQIDGDHTRNNRYYKINPHKVFPEYDISIYVDGNFLIIGDVVSLVKSSLKDHDMSCFDHSQTTSDKRDCIYDEYEAILKMGQEKGDYKDDTDIMLKQISKLKDDAYPKNNGLIVGGVLIRRHHEPKVVGTMNDWWQILLKGSKRDQLSFNYVAWKNNFQYKLLNGDARYGNPWFRILGSNRRNYTGKLIKYRLLTFLGLK